MTKDFCPRAGEDAGGGPRATSIQQHLQGKFSSTLIDHLEQCHNGATWANIEKLRGVWIFYVTCACFISIQIRQLRPQISSSM